jgi:hypothetical protein
MDPNLFHLDWERTFEVLAAIVGTGVLRRAGARAALREPVVGRPGDTRSGQPAVSIR